MKLIGTGYWYNVYDLGNGRVLKVEKGIWQKILDSLRHEWRYPRSLFKTIYELLTGSTAVAQRYARLRTTIDLTLLGAPVFREGIDYEQDELVVLGQMLEGATDDIKHELIDKYIDGIIKLWNYGFADCVFNFTINSGITKTEEVLLLDFNEITFSKAMVLQDIHTQRWLKAWSYKNIDQNLQIYYAHKMKTRLTPESLEVNWLR